MGHWYIGRHAFFLGELCARVDYMELRKREFDTSNRKSESMRTLIVTITRLRKASARYSLVIMHLCVGQEAHLVSPFL